MKINHESIFVNHVVLTIPKVLKLDESVVEIPTVMSYNAT